ncbi:MAG: hypothetical protein ACLQU4_04900 [Limisphaerales bacterium]
MSTIRENPDWRGVLAGLALLAFVTASPGQVSVETIGGGIRTECGSSAGFVRGNTYTTAQFDQPYAAALDSQGNLWIADLKNWDVEQVSQAGDLTASITYPYYSGSNHHPFTNVLGIAVDSGNNLYVLTTNKLWVYQNVIESFPNLNLMLPLSLSVFSSSPATATAIAVVNDANTNIYISFTNSSGGTIIRIPQPYAPGVYSVVVNNYAFAPAGLAMRQDGRLAVSDTLSNAIYVVPTNTGSTPLLVAGGHGPGFTNGTSHFSSFNQPHGIAASGDGRMVVCDTMNNYLRLIDTNFNTTTLYGTPSNVWTRTCCNCSPALYAGWVDGAAGNTTSNASGREPVSVTISSNGTLFVTELYYNLIRSVTGSGLTPVTSIGSITSSSNLPILTTVEANPITPSNAWLNASVNPNGSQTTVWFEWGTSSTNLVNRTTNTVVPNVPVTTNVSSLLTNLQPNEVIYFQAFAQNVGGGTNGSILFFTTGAAASTSNQLGFAYSPSAGIGATPYIPIVMNLQSGGELTSLQFLIEVTPIPPNTNVISSLSMLQITSNDFVQSTGPAPGNAAVNFQLSTYDNGQELLVFAGPGSGLDMQGSGVVGLLTFQIPSTASVSNQYSLNILYPSGSVSNIIPMTNILTVADIPYLVGDSWPPNGYNAGEFGDGVLDDDDVVDAIYASMGVRVPPLSSDAYNAMCVLPQLPGSGVINNGVPPINNADWNEILLRSEGLDTPNWIRFWTNEGNGGVLFGESIASPGGLPGDPFVAAIAAVQESGPPPGLVWRCQASVGAGTVANLVPGNTCSLPVYVNVLPGYSLPSLQFRAIVSPNGNAPPVSQVQFTAATGIPSPPFSSLGLSSNDILSAWGAGAFSSPLQYSNYLGTISFKIPTNAQTGQSYAVRFSYVDGSNGTNDYAMESFPGNAWVLSPALQPASITSDEWKLHFFGSRTSSLAGDDVDADGDGAPNWQEYLAGTDPTNPHSVLQFGSAGTSTNGVSGVALSWLTAPGKNYILESIPALGGTNWTAINTNTGDGYIYQLIQTNYQGSAKFYRILLQP